MRTTTGAGSTRSSALLTSQPLSATSGKCALQFYYYMNETSYTSLSVRAKQGALTSRLFLVSGRTNNKWVKQVMGIGTKPAGNLII